MIDNRNCHEAGGNPEKLLLYQSDKTAWTGGPMDYEGRICRTPGERGSFKLPISVGCPYNACAFCDLFKDLEYRELPLDQI